MFFIIIIIITTYLWIVCLVLLKTKKFHSMLSDGLLSYQKVKYVHSLSIIEMCSNF